MKRKTEKAPWPRGLDYRTVMVFIGSRQLRALSRIAWLVVGILTVVAAWFVLWVVRGRS
jgi:purine-cytosine permease-like protein